MFFYVFVKSFASCRPSLSCNRNTMIPSGNAMVFCICYLRDVLRFVHGVSCLFSNLSLDNTTSYM